MQVLVFIRITTLSSIYAHSIQYWYMTCSVLLLCWWMNTTASVHITHTRPTKTMIMLGYNLRARLFLILLIRALFRGWNLNIVTALFQFMHKRHAEVKHKIIILKLCASHRPTTVASYLFIYFASKKAL